LHESRQHREADKSTAGGQQADAEARRGMTWLRQAVITGYKDVAHMKQDEELDSLSDRADRTSSRRC
jgi:hypothetical protein